MASRDVSARALQLTCDTQAQVESFYSAQTEPRKKTNRVSGVMNSSLGVLTVGDGAYLLIA